MSPKAPKLNRHKITSRGTGAGVDHRTAADRADAAAVAAAVDAVHILAPATAVGMPRPGSSTTTDTTDSTDDQTED